LERTARRDQQVREELSEIAAATARASLQSLRQADRDQQRLTRRIEMSDPAFHERSLQQANRVAELTRHLNQLRQIHDKLLTGDAKQSLSESEQQRIERVARMLNQAAAQSVDPAQPHAAIAEATAWIAEKLTSVRESIEEIRGELADTQSDSRRSSQHHRRQAEQWLREARDRTIAALRLRQQQLAGDETASRQAKEIAGELERLQARPIEKLASGDAKREATERLAEQLGAETQQIEAEFAELLQAARQLSPPQIPADAVAALADHQDEIAGEVDRIGNDLRRAAIHQQRVGTSDAAQELAGSAERVKAIANKSAARAATELRRSASEPSSSADAHRRAVETFRQIQIESNRLAELLGEPSGQGSAQSPSEPGSDRGQRLAETLDELDRTLQHDTSQTQPKAGEASQTLEQAIQQHAAQAAQTRAQSSSSQPGSNTRQTPSPEPSRRSGQSIGTNSEEQGELSIDSIDRRGAEWGSLREQRGRDGGPVEADVTAQYRRQIEAYFRAIAGRQQRASPSP